ncbi:putative DD41D transposase [Trichonephila clavipes]|nr:putative DD41D transposase [Trichonephila clavipes]
MAAILNLTTSVIKEIRRTLDAIHNAANQDLHLVTHPLGPVWKTKTCDLPGSNAVRTSDWDETFSKQLMTLLIADPANFRLKKSLQTNENGQIDIWIASNSSQPQIIPAGMCIAEMTDIEDGVLNGYVNKQNCRIWSEANPQVYVETPLHPEKLTVWCALWAGGIIGPYFFKNDEGHNVTVTGDRYRAMITNFFIPELNNHDVQELWFQQDGATCHTARVTIDLLKDTFGDRLISRFGPVNWPPRSCDLTPLDCFLWGYVKSLVYADKPQTLDHLEDNIRRVIADIRPQMLEKVIENWTSRLDYIRASPMPEIIFKI